MAARVLERVERDGAYAAAALDAELERAARLDPRDRALATELVYGVLRTRGALVSRLSRHAPRGLPADTLVVAHLLVAAYQILLLDKVPTFAAVDSAVSAIKSERNARIASFANAVLRRLAAGQERFGRDAAIVESVPHWLMGELERAVGPLEARALLGATGGGHAEAVAVRVREGASLPSFLAGAEHGRASPVARLVPRGGDLRRREGYREGAFVVQEEGAQVVALALGARAGERVLDACSGRGQKTSLLRERVGPDAELWATDLYEEKLRALEAEFERLGLERPATSAVDWTVGAGEVPDGFDRVLVDAPCTGTGTLRRRPEIAARLSPEDPARMGRVAEAILRGAASRAKVGGRVVFAVCSVLVDECEAVVTRVREVLEPVPFDAPELAPLFSPDATSFRLSPLRHGTDGFFVASFVRRS